MAKPYVVLMMRPRGKRPYTWEVAWAAENRLVLAQVAVEEKSNEITAIPKLLRQLALVFVYCDH